MAQLVNNILCFLFLQGHRAQVSVSCHVIAVVDMLICVACFVLGLGSDTDTYLMQSWLRLHIVVVVCLVTQFMHLGLVRLIQRHRLIQASRRMSFGLLVALVLSITGEVLELPPVVLAVIHVWMTLAIAMCVSFVVPDPVSMTQLSNEHLVVIAVGPKKGSIAGEQIYDFVLAQDGQMYPFYGLSGAHMGLGRVPADFIHLPPGILYGPAADMNTLAQLSGDGKRGSL